jgi:phage/plasmid-like protein (TIGR03299 family)
MSANLATDRNGNAMIASFRQMPWHGQGTVFDTPVNGQEMLKLAGLDFDVLSCPIFGQVRTETGKTAAIGWDAATDAPVMGRVLTDSTRAEEVDGVRGIYRSDTGAILGLASDKYEIFQNREMVEVIDQIGVDGVTYEVAGGLGKGERVWVLAHIPDLSYEVKGDAMKQYLTIFTSHDGSSALNIFPTTVRVVCANTWRAATVERRRMEQQHGTQTVKAGFSIKHTRNMKQMVAQAVEAFKATVEANKFSREFYRSLAEVPATHAMKDEFFGFIVDGGKDEKARADEMSKRTETRRQNKRDELEMLLKMPTNQTDAARGTAWGLFNAASEWIDHLAPTRKVNGKDEAASRFESSQFGGGCDLKDAAMGKIAELAGV